MTDHTVTSCAGLVLAIPVMCVYSTKGVGSTRYTCKNCFSVTHPSTYITWYMGWPAAGNLCSAKV